MKKIFAAIIVMLFCFTIFNVCATTDQEKTDRISNISFSPDGKKLLFNRYRSNQSRMIQTYNMDTGELIAYKPPVGEWWDYPQYSFDGKYIVFVTTPMRITHEKVFFLWENTIEDYFPNNSQIAIMDKDGNNVRKITNTLGYKAHPSFSHSGKKIIFSRGDQHKKRNIGWDRSVNEVDLNTGKETCLTQFKFGSISKPYYFPDDKTFIFGGDYITLAPGMSREISHEDSLKVEKIRKELKSKYKDNSIYVMQGNEQDIKPYIVMPEYQKRFKDYVAVSEYSNSPVLSADSSVLIFRAQGYKPDGSADGDHLYQYSTDGNHQSITRIPHTETEEAVSFDGKQIALIPAYSNRIIIYQVKDGTSKEITLPEQPSRIINGQ